MQHLSFDTLIDYVHRELAPDEDARVLAHLEACETCARELNLETAIAERLRIRAREEELELPLGMSSAIMARIASLRPSPLAALLAPFRHGPLRPLLFVPAAVAIAAAAVFLPVTTQRTTGPAFPVSYYLEEHAAHAQENPLADRSSTVMMTSLERTVSTETVPLIQSVNAASIMEDGAR